MPDQVRYDKREILRFFYGTIKIKLNAAALIKLVYVLHIGLMLMVYIIDNQEAHFLSNHLEDVKMVERIRAEPFNTIRHNVKTNQSKNSPKLFLS